MAVRVDLNISLDGFATTTDQTPEEPFGSDWPRLVGAYAATLELWQRFPVAGSGMASFREAFPLLQPAAIPGGWWHAHNDWLEGLATLGIPGAVLFLGGLGLLVLRLFQVLAGDNRAEDRAAALAAYGALAAVAVHSALDFGLTLPANALTLAILVGAAAAAPTEVSGERVRTGRSSRRRGDAPRRGGAHDARPDGAGPPPPDAP